MKSGFPSEYKIPQLKSGLSEGPSHLFIVLLICLVLNIYSGVQYVRGGYAQWVNMQVDTVILIEGGRYEGSDVHLNYHGAKFIVSFNRSAYRWLRDKKEMQVLHIPGTDYIQTYKGAAGYNWSVCIFFTVVYLVFKLCFGREDFQKLYKFIRGK